MKNSSQDTRSGVIAAFTRAMLRQTGTSMATFGMEVRHKYESAVPGPLRCIAFSDRKDVFDRARIDAQKLKRYIDDEIDARLPVDLEEAWVTALPEPYRTDCLRALAWRMGLIGALRPDPGATPLMCAGMLSKEFGEAMTAIADSDLSGTPQATEAAIKELDDLIAAATSMRERLR